ncbi:MAG: OmpA family protein [Dermatophilaceae bacterium]
MARCWRCAIFAVIFALLLGLLFLFFSKSRIDGGLAADAETTLSRAGIGGVNAASDWGRVTLRGPAASSDAALAAADDMDHRSAVRDVRYVATDSRAGSAPESVVDDVDVDIAVAAAGVTPRVRLTGTVPTAADRTSLVQAAGAAYGTDQVDDQLTVRRATGSGTPVVSRLAGLVSTLEPDVSTAAFSLDQSGLSVTGSGTTPEAAGRANSAVAAAARNDPPLEVSGTVTAPAAPTPPDAASVQRDIDAAVRAQSIVFATSSNQLTPAAVRTVDRVAAILKTAPTTRVAIAGFTDNRGSQAGNLALSTRRAEAVRVALVQRGIAAGRLTAAGRGSASPIATNATEAGRASNRRITFTVQKG